MDEIKHDGYPLIVRCARRNEWTGTPYNRPFPRLHDVFDIWLDNWAASPPHLQARTFQTLSPGSTSRDDGHGTLVRRSRELTVTKGNLHAHGYRKVLQRPKGLRLHPAGQRRKDVFVHATALERAGISGLREGQKVAFDTQNDARSGKIAVGKIEIA